MNAMAWYQRHIVELNGFKLRSVCYDLQFPVWMRQQPGGRHFGMMPSCAWLIPLLGGIRGTLQARAVENPAYVVVLTVVKGRAGL